MPVMRPGLRPLPRIATLLLLIAGSRAPVAAAQRSEGAPVRIYTYSRATAGGFADERLDAFRREIGEQAGDAAELGYSREDADVSVHLLGQGSLTVKLSAAGDTDGYLFVPDETEPRTWALLSSGEHSIEIAEEGSGMRVLTRLARSVAEWVRRNAGTLREDRLERTGKSPTGAEGRSP